MSLAELDEAIGDMVVDGIAIITGIALTSLICWAVYESICAGVV